MLFVLIVGGSLESKPLFNDDESYTLDGSGFDFNVKAFFKKLFEEHPEYKIREMSEIIAHAAHIEGARAILKRRHPGMFPFT